MNMRQMLELVVADLEVLHKTTEEYKKNRRDEYGRYFVRGKRDFVDFSDEVRASSGWLLASSKWKLEKKEEQSELRQAIEILNEDVALLRDAKGVDGATKERCKKVLEQLKKIEVLIGGAGSTGEFKLPR